MGSTERITLINSIEKIFFEQAFQSFNEKHPGKTNRVKEYINEDEDYLVKYYTTFTKNWLNYLTENELKQIMTEKITAGFTTGLQRDSGLV